jgi:hypothetical protein
LRNRDAAAVRAAIQADIVEGGAGLVRLLTDLDERRLDEASPLGGGLLSISEIVDAKA